MQNSIIFVVNLNMEIVQIMIMLKMCFVFALKKANKALLVVFLELALTNSNF